MKVLQINSVCGYGSTGRIATDLYDILEKEGHKCCIAYGRGNAPNGYNTIRIGNKFDFYYHVLKTRLFDLHGFGSKRATKKLIKKIKEYKPDIIHLHNLHGYYLNIELLFNYLSEVSIPVVWLLHDQWAFSGHGAHFKLDEKGKIPVKNLEKIQKKDYPKSLFRDNSRENFSRKKDLFTSLNNMTVVTPSKWLAEIANESFLSEYKIKVINNGIDLSKFKLINTNFKEKYDLADKKLILGVANVWSEKKGLDYFNELAYSLDDSFKIILVGLDKINIKLNKKILQIPKTNSIEQLAEIYTAADIYVNPTLEDNFPTTNIESLACGTPVITFDTGGSSEMLTSSTGIKIVTGDSNELYKAINNFDYKKKDNISCRNRAKKYDKDDVYLKYVDLYKNLFRT